MSTSAASNAQAICLEAHQALHAAGICAGVSVTIGTFDGESPVVVAALIRRSWLFKGRNLPFAQQVEGALRARGLRLVGSRLEPSVAAVQQLAAGNGRWVAVRRLSNAEA